VNLSCVLVGGMAGGVTLPTCLLGGRSEVCIAVPPPHALETVSCLGCRGGAERGRGTMGGLASWGQHLVAWKKQNKH
jgi:hypothetical protein